MNLRAEIDKLKAAIKPKVQMRFVTDATQITEEAGIIWVLFTF